MDNKPKPTRFVHCIKCDKPELMNQGLYRIKIYFDPEATTVKEIDLSDIENMISNFLSQVNSIRGSSYAFIYGRYFRSEKDRVSYEADSSYLRNFDSMDGLEDSIEGHKEIISRDPVLRIVKVDPYMTIIDKITYRGIELIFKFLPWVDKNLIQKYHSGVINPRLRGSVFTAFDGDRVARIITIDVVDNTPEEETNDCSK